jgi:hypothetical protein
MDPVMHRQSGNYTHHRSLYEGCPTNTDGNAVQRHFGLSWSELRNRGMRATPVFNLDSNVLGLGKYIRIPRVHVHGGQTLYAIGLNSALFNPMTEIDPVGSILGILEVKRSEEIRN